MLVTSHAERVCGEYRRALCVLHTLHAWRQSAENRVESVETLSFALSFCGQSPGVWWGSNIWSETQRIRLLSRCKEASGNWRGETTCCEYRWEQLLTPAAQQSAVRLDKAERTSLRRIQLYIGLSIQAVSHPLSIDALLAPYLHLIFFFFLLHPGGENWLPAIGSPRSAQKTNRSAQKPESGETRLWLWHAVSCFSSGLDLYYGFAVSEIHREDQYDQFLPAPTWGQPPSRWTGCRRGKRSEDPSATRRWQTPRPVPQKMLEGGWGCKTLLLYLPT